MDLKLNCPKGFVTRGVRVRFANPVTFIIGYRVTSLSPPSPLERVEVCADGADIRWTTPLDGVEVVFSIDLASGQAVVANAFWRDAAGTLQGKPVTEADAVFLQALSFWQLPARRAVLESVRRALLSAIPDEGDPRRRIARQYFCELDFNTNPLLMDLSGMGSEVLQRRAAILKQVADVLMERVLGRLDAAMLNSGSVPADLPQADVELVKEVSWLQLEIVRRHLAPGGKLDADLAWRTFLWFANGDLKLPGRLWAHWDCGPAGGFLFFFAEFALMAIEMGVHSASWSMLLGPTVAMQRVYTRAYQPAKGAVARQFADYKPGNWSQNQQVPADEMDALRAEYEKLSPEDLPVRVGEHAREAFPGSYRIKAAVTPAPAPAPVPLAVP